MKSFYIYFLLVLVLNLFGLVGANAKSIDDLQICVNLKEKSGKPVKNKKILFNAFITAEVRSIYPSEIAKYGFNFSNTNIISIPKNREDALPQLNDKGTKCITYSSNDLSELLSGVGANRFRTLVLSHFNLYAGDSSQNNKSFLTYDSGLYSSHTITANKDKTIRVDITFIKIDATIGLPPTPEISIPLEEIIY